MKKRISLLLTGLLLTGILHAQKIININNNLRLIRLSKHAYIHEAFSMTETWGRIGSNGMLLIENGKAFLFDTPMTDSVTRQLLVYIQDSMKLTITGFITADWHGDSMGGLQAVKEKGIPSYAGERTIKIAMEKGLPVPDHGLADSTTISFGSFHLVGRYFGPAHTMDHIVVWIPEEKILFADCMVKETASKDLGYTDDGDLKAYASTLQKVKAAFPLAKIVVPGHGQHGGMKLVDHTITLTKQ
ncbi:MAG: subclass B1 metallo-beta-lactamase [Chitinophagaceae bacterium]|nr:subclass B1 metallo-beta-lactamase [Chitinophagaceae bacterium]